MSRHNQQHSVEEGRSFLKGTHAMKSVKPGVDILEGHSTGVNMGVSVSAPYLIQKWLNEFKQAPSFMLGGLGKQKAPVTSFCAPQALAWRRNLWRDLKILVLLRASALPCSSCPRDLT
jgi:hypothetical protein